ncbi:MAG: PEP-CTERM sorting domain-containing protein [Akkermansiaceae bacterium]
MKMKTITKSMKHLTSKTAATAAIAAAFVLAPIHSSQAVITITGGSSFTLDAGPSSVFDAGNIIDKAGITATGPSTNGATPDKLLDDAINKDFPNTMWYNNATGMVDVTFTFSGPVTLTGIKVDWAWGNTDDGTYDLRPNGASIGTYSVTGGGDFPARDPSHFLFDSAQTGVNTFILSIDAIQAPALAEVTFYGSAVPEPSTTALLGLGGLALILRRRK